MEAIAKQHIGKTISVWADGAAWEGLVFTTTAGILFLETNPAKREMAYIRISHITAIQARRSETKNKIE
jgi:hypothetical protein